MDNDNKNALPLKESDWLSHREVTMGKLPTCCLLAFVIQLFSFVLYPYSFKEDLSKYVRYQTLITLCENPFTSEPLAEPTVRHRIFVPLLAWGMGLRGNTYIVLIFIGTYFFLLNTLLLLRRSLPLRMAALTTLLLSTTLAVITSQSWLTVQDSIGNAIIVLSMLLGRYTWTFGPLLFFAMLADERSITMTPLVLLWFYWHDHPEERRSLLGWRILSIVAVGCIYALVYVGLHRFDTPLGTENYYGHEDQSSFIDSMLTGKVFLQQAAFAPAGLWFGLRGAWLLPILLIWHYRSKKRWLTDWLLIGILAATIHGLLVEDMSRMASLAFPAVLLSIVIFHQSRPAFTRFLVSMCLMVNILSPQYQINNTRSTLLIPLPLQFHVMDHIK